MDQQSPYCSGLAVAISSDHHPTALILSLPQKNFSNAGPPERASSNGHDIKDLSLPNIIELIISEIELFLAGDDEVLSPVCSAGIGQEHLRARFCCHRGIWRTIQPTAFLAATHSVEFAERWGRRIRNDIAADENVLGIKLSEDSKAAARWSLASGGEYYGVGAGTGISGFRANLGVGDDLFGSREDAYSETVRQKRWDWYQDDFSARLKPGAKRILMNTRWHEEDVAGRVLEQIERKEIRGQSHINSSHRRGKRRVRPKARGIPVGRSHRLQLRLLSSCAAA